MRAVAYSLSILLCFARLLCLPALAQNPCADGGSPLPHLSENAPQGGIGGTGIDDGIGGTGHGDEIEGGIGGTARNDAPEGGIGGTARIDDPRPAEGGVGGTGIQRGIVGVVTGFASICVGGTEVFLDADTRLSIDGAPATGEALAVGQVVEIVARERDGSTHASRVGLEHIVIGEVTRTDADNSRIYVLNQPVQLSEDTRRKLAGGDVLARAGEFRSGEHIAVNGLRRDDGVIIASRITDVDGDVAQLSGLLESRDGNRLLVSGSTVLAGTAPDAAEGTAVLVRGEWNGREIEASEVTPRQTFAGATMQQIELEGYLKQPPVGDTIRVGDFDVQVSPATRARLAQIDARQRLRFQVDVRPDGILSAVGATPLRPLPPPPPPRPAPVRPRSIDADNPAMHGGPPSGAPEGTGFDHRPPPAGGRPTGIDHPPRPAPANAPPPRPPRPSAVRPPGIDVPHGPQPPRPPRPPRPH